MTMSQTAQNRRKRKAQYRKGRYGHGAKHARTDGSGDGPTTLTASMRGFIVTCNKRERESGYEVMHLLEDALQRISPPSEDSNSASSSSDDDDNDDVEDIEAAMRQEADKEVKKRKFRVVTTGVSNTVFIESTVETRSPTALVNEVFWEMITSRRGRPRFALRMLPVEAVCRVDDVPGLRQACRDLWADFIDHHRIKRPERPTFSVDFKSRNFSAKPASNGDAAAAGQVVDKEAAIAAWVDAVRARSPEFRVDMVAPTTVLAVNVLRKCVCLGVLEFREEFAKYNLHEVLAAPAPKERPSTGGGEEGNAADAP